MIDDVACEPVGAARKFRCHRVVQIAHGERTARTDRQLAPERQSGIDAARDLRVAAVSEIIEVAAKSADVRIRARNLRRDIIFRLVEGERSRAAEGCRAALGGSFRQREGERRRRRSAVLLGDVSHVVGVFYRRAFDKSVNLLLRDIQSSRPCQRGFHFLGILLMFDILRHIFGTQRRRRVRSAVRPAVELRGGAVSRDLVLQLHRTRRILHAFRRRRLLPCHSRRAAPRAEEGRILRLHIHIPRRRIRWILDERDVRPVQLRFRLCFERIERETSRSRDLHRRHLLVLLRLRRDVVRRTLLGVPRRICGFSRVPVRQLLCSSRRIVCPALCIGGFGFEDVRRTLRPCVVLSC